MGFFIGGKKVVNGNLKNSELYTEYYFRQLQKVANKKYEFYVISKILNILDEPKLKFVTQQYVRLDEHRYALTDLYFPTLNLHIEIDEGHHFDFSKNVEISRNEEKVEKKELSHKDKDRIREADIVKATQQEIKRINVFKDLNTQKKKTLAEIDIEIKSVVELIKAKQNATKWEWDIQKEFNPQTYIEKGFLDADEDVLLLNGKDVMRCFDTTYNSHRGGGRKHPHNNDVFIWMPKFFENTQWKNTISEDYKVIIEQCKDEVERIGKAEKWKKGPQYRIVFARVKSSLLLKNQFMFRFYGLYKLKVADDVKGAIWELEHKRVELKKLTYS